MQPEKSSLNKTQKEEFKQIFSESVRKSYFNGFKNDKNLSKSRIQTDEIIIEQEVDEETFRIMRQKLKPDDSHFVYRQTGRFYLEEEGFFSCISSRRRYQVQLKNFKLKVTNENGKIEQFFNFETETGEARARGGHFSVEIDHSKGRTYFEPVQVKQADQIVDDWVTLINKVINTSDAKRKRFCYLPDKQDDFYKYEHVSHEEFAKFCNSLDIVLFRSQHSAARVQRFFTDSQYDHVAVVLRNKKNEIFLFESTSDEGVGLTPWKHMVKYQWYKSTDVIAWRKLNMGFSEKDISVIEAFVAKTLGKEFEISLNKIFAFNSVLNRSAQDDEKKTYFCSELVARLYKELGLLDEEKASTRYYPVDFSQKVNMKFNRKDASLSNEIVIAFNR